MRLTNYLCFAKERPEDLPSARDTQFKYAHANREAMKKLREKLKLYKESK